MAVSKEWKENLNTLFHALEEAEDVDNFVVGIKWKDEYGAAQMVYGDSLDALNNVLGLAHTIVENEEKIPNLILIQLLHNGIDTMAEHLNASKKKTSNKSDAKEAIEALLKLAELADEDEDED